MTARRLGLLFGCDRAVVLGGRVIIPVKNLIACWMKIPARNLKTNLSMYSIICTNRYKILHGISDKFANIPVNY